jgi:hypothetical protein
MCGSDDAWTSIYPMRADQTNLDERPQRATTVNFFYSMPALVRLI